MAPRLSTGRRIVWYVTPGLGSLLGLGGLSDKTHRLGSVERQTRQEPADQHSMRSLEASDSANLSRHDPSLLPCVGGRPFWVALAALSILCLVGVSGAVHASSLARTERRLSLNGVRAHATVLRRDKIRPVTLGPAIDTYLVTYRFFSPTRPVVARARLTGPRWAALRVGSPLAVRYMPNRPEENLLEGTDPDNHACLWVMASLGCSAFCALLLGGLVAARCRDRRNNAQRC